MKKNLNFILMDTLFEIHPKFRRNKNQIKNSNHFKVHFLFPIHSLFFCLFSFFSIFSISCTPSSKSKKNTYELLYKDRRYYLGPVQLSPEQKKRVPLLQLPNPSNDFSYTHSIKNLIEQKARTLSQNETFIQIIKATAWVRSQWEHYREITKNKYYVLTDQYENLIGIMQIDQRIHGAYLHLEENLAKGITLLYDFYRREFINDGDTICPDGGSNSGSGNEPKIRRIYASYDEGYSKRCRNNHENDNQFYDVFSNQPYAN